MSRNAEEENRRLAAEARTAELIKENDSLLHWKVRVRIQECRVHRVPCGKTAATCGDDETFGFIVYV